MSGIHIGKRRRSDSTQRNKKHTASGNTRHVEAKRSERQGQQRERDDTPGHPVIQPPDSPVEVTPHTSRWRPGEPVGRRVGTLRPRPGEPVGVRGRYLRHQSGRRPGESVGMVVDTTYLPPHSRRRWPGEPVGARVRTFCWGALPLTPGP